MVNWNDFSLNLIFREKLSDLSTCNNRKILTKELCQVPPGHGNSVRRRVGPGTNAWRGDFQSGAFLLDGIAKLN
jgi:hypothetical protein